MTAHPAAVLLLDLVVIAGAARILGLLARRLGQPAVIGEILGGILLGPTLFGGALTRTLFPAEVQPWLTMLANVGVAVFMFLVGVELDRNLLRGQGRIASGVALCAIVLPFALGGVLALYLLGHHPSTKQPAFVLFLGTAMAITAFPVLARILTDRGLLATPIGALALACASIDDILAWSLLAVVTALAGAAAGLWQVLLVVPYAAVLLLVVRPLLARSAARAETAGWTRRPVSGRVGAAGVLVIVAGGLWLSAEATQWMGLHLIFGAFLFGVAMPRDHGARLRAWTQRWVGRTCSVLLLPIFFMVAGTSVDLSKVDGKALLDLGLILLVAIGGKGLGAFAGARLSGVQPRHSAVLAILLNTRGLTELIALTVGLQLHVIDTGLYSLMVVMALVTTAMTGVLLRFVYPEKRARADMGPRTTIAESEALS
ncbi:cation:proton antiporter [Pseudonocardia xinjiangensis]|uniref:Cation/H(+) antiporter n=1 Tax=Pseudonocardia xinjiangensis TaxID=75289 RepID=A0ABX1R8E9_9PSEU|nr:cation:proton antiporter [Pseudonocardia xinjiangensis]NMH76164.1 cation/H(+) antiporter [Pseudonocardia xinjiangensis]